MGAIAVLSLILIVFISVILIEMKLSKLQQFTLGLLIGALLLGVIFLAQRI